MEQVAWMKADMVPVTRIAENATPSFGSRILDSVAGSTKVGAWIHVC